MECKGIFCFFFIDYCWFFYVGVYNGFDYFWKKIENLYNIFIIFLMGLSLIIKGLGLL